MKCVMIVEDETDVQELLVEVISSEGFRVWSFSDGESAFDHFNRNSCDYLITDLLMQGQGGVELIRKVREINTQVPILAVTGDTPCDSHKEMQRTLNVQLLYKPFHIEQIFNFLNP